MEEGGKKANSKGLIALLCVLIVVIIGLGIGIAVAIVNNHVTETEYSLDGDAGLEALQIQEDIDAKYADDPEYSIDDAIAEYEREMSTGSNAKRVYVGINYASFIYDAYEDIDRAAEIMLRVEPLLDNDDIAIDYYVAMRGFYTDAEDDAMVEYYNQKVLELMPEDTRPIEELLPKEGEEE